MHTVTAPTPIYTSSTVWVQIGANHLSLEPGAWHLEFDCAWIEAIGSDGPAFRVFDLASAQEVFASSDLGTGHCRTDCQVTFYQRACLELQWRSQDGIATNCERCVLRAWRDEPIQWVTTWDKPRTWAQRLMDEDFE